MQTTKYQHTPGKKWSLYMMAALFGLAASNFGRYVNGLSYPTLQTMQKFEAVMGWPVSEQVQLIPPYWEWPLQDNGSGQKPGQPVDFRYGIMLSQVLREWGAANPRTVLSSEIRQHPAIPGRAGTKKRDPSPAEFRARSKPLGKK